MVLLLRKMPLPQIAKDISIIVESQLAYAETLVECCEIYMWLGNRRDFARLAGSMERVRAMKYNLSAEIDSALLSKKIKHRKQCRECGGCLPLFHEYAICERCYQSRRRNWRDWNEGEEDFDDEL